MSAPTASLEASQHRYAAEVPDLGPLFRRAREAMLAIEPGGGIVGCNRAAAELLGLDEGDITGVPLAGALPLAGDGLAAWLAGDMDAPLIAPLARPDGGERQVELSGGPLEGCGDGRALVLLIARDVTARVASEAALRAGAESFATLFEATAEGIAITDGGIILAANAAFAALVRREPGELIGLWSIDLTAPGDRERVLAAVRTGDERPYEIELLHADGGTVAVETVGRPIRYAGRVVRLATFRDITARRASEAALRASEARFAAFMEHSPAVAFMKDENGRFVYANRALERRFDLGQDDVIGKTDFDLWPAETARQLREHDAAVLRDDRAAELIEEVPTPDGGMRRWQVYKFPLVDAVGGRYLSGMAIDITDHLRAEERLLALHEASVRLAAVREPRELVAQLLQQAVALLGAGSGTFYRWDGAAELLRCTYNWRVPASDTTPDQRPGQGLAGGVFVRRRTLIVNDYLNWEDAMPSGIVAGLRAALAVPLVRAGAILGVVVVRAYDDAIRFDEADARLLELFGDQAAIALENARLDDLAHAELAERRRTEAHLRESEARFRALAGAAFEAIAISEDEVIREVNPAFCALFGYDAEEAVGLAIRDVVAPEALETALAQARAGSDAPYEAIGLRRDGRGFAVEVRGRTTILDGRAVRITAVRDIGERKRHEAELARRATHDPLTDLPNRAHLLDWLAAALASGPVGLLFLDLDGFKAVNDRLGHAGGDRLLVRVARLLQGCARDGDLVARLGGDEFVVALRGVATAGTTTAVARRVLAAFATPGALAEGGGGVGVSIGVALGADEPPDGLLRRADEALYAVKRSGKGRYAVWSAALLSAAS